MSLWAETYPDLVNKYLSGVVYSLDSVPSSVNALDKPLPSKEHLEYLYFPCLCLLHQHTQYCTVSKAPYTRNQLWLTSELKYSVQNMHCVFVYLCVYTCICCMFMFISR